MHPHRLLKYNVETYMNELWIALESTPINMHCISKELLQNMTAETLS